MVPTCFRVQRSGVAGYFRSIDETFSCRHPGKRVSWHVAGINQCPPCLEGLHVVEKLGRDGSGIGSSHRARGIREHRCPRDMPPMWPRRTGSRPHPNGLRPRALTHVSVGRAPAFAKKPARRCERHPAPSAARIMRRQTRNDGPIPNTRRASAQRSAPHASKALRLRRRSRRSIIGVGVHPSSPSSRAARRSAHSRRSRSGARSKSGGV